MIAGISLAVYKVDTRQTVMAQAPPLQWNVSGKMPLDLQLDLDKRLSSGSEIKDSIRYKDSIILRDSVVFRIHYKMRTLAPRTEAREAGNHLTAITPDSMPSSPTNISTLVREEQTNDSVDVSKTPSIQLIVDGQTVYSRNDNHSTEGSQ